MKNSVHASPGGCCSPERKRAKKRWDRTLKEAKKLSDMFKNDKLVDEQEQRAREFTKAAEEVSKTWNNVSNRNNCGKHIDNNGGSSKPLEKRAETEKTGGSSKPLEKGQKLRRRNTGYEIFSTLLVLSVFLYPTHSRLPSLTHEHTHTHTHTHTLSLCVCLLQKEEKSREELARGKSEEATHSTSPGKMSAVCTVCVRKTMYESASASASASVSEFNTHEWGFTTMILCLAAGGRVS